MIGLASLAAVAMASAGTFYLKMLDTGVQPIMVSANVDPHMRAEEATFAERIAPVLTAAPAVEVAQAPPKKPNVYVALFDATYSLGSPPDMFTMRTPARSDQQVAMLTPEVETPKPPQVLPLPPVSVPQMVKSVPLPTARPAEVRLPPTPTATAAVSGHEMMVQRARATVLANTAAASKMSIFEKLFGPSEPAKTVLAYAGSDGGVMSDGRDSAGARPGLYDRQTAVYDISARTVYMPNGAKLEAHSGLGDRLDDPRYAHERMRGVTPPHVYDLKPREALFHGVAALRLTPVGGEGAIYGRSGLLAHTYMLGPNGDSNGCVSFKDYNAFLRAYRNGEVKRLVVAKL